MTGSDLQNEDTECLDFTPRLQETSTLVVLHEQVCVFMPLALYELVRELGGLAVVVCMVGLVWFEICIVLCLLMLLRSSECVLRCP